MKKLPKIIVILGPTASGKSALAVKIARKFNGEVISADSRQVYKGMDIGTGKVTEKEMAGVPHHLIDVTSPKKVFTVSQYKKLAAKKIGEILKRSKLPIICGSSGFYIQSVVDNIIIPSIKPDKKLRAKLMQKSTGELFEQLKKLDPRRAKSIDKHNRYRLVRALEIIIKSGKRVPPIISKPTYEPLFIGIKRNKKELKKLIKERLLKRLKEGMVKEVIGLKKAGVRYERLEDFGLEYRYIAYYLQNKLNYDDMVKKLQMEIEHYAKRQLTWFKKNKRIKWITNEKEAGKLIRGFLSL